MSKSSPLNEKFKIWLRLMLAEHRELDAKALAIRMGIAPEMFYRLDQRPGVFNADTLDNISTALELPAWIIVQAIEAGRVIEVHRAVSGIG